MMLQAIEPRMINLAKWLEAPQFLSPDEAARLAGRSRDDIDRMIDDDAVELVEEGSGYLIEKQSLYDFEESLEIVQHWDD